MKTLSTIALSLLAAVALQAATKNIVIVAGPPSHASGEHEFNAGAQILAKALNEQSGLDVKVTVSTHKWPDAEAIAAADAIIVYSDGRRRHPANGQLQQLDKELAKGKGFMCMHYAVDVPKGEFGDMMTKWIGGYYEAGWSINPHWNADLKPKMDHPVARGVKPQRVHDEWYYNMRFPKDKKAVDLLTAIIEQNRIRHYNSWEEVGPSLWGTNQTLMWGVERPDGGRGIGFTGGHWHKNWALDNYRKMVLNAIVWVAGIEVPEGGVKSEPVTLEQLNANLDKKKKMKAVPMPSDKDFEFTPAKPKPLKKKK